MWHENEEFELYRQESMEDGYSPEESEKGASKILKVNRTVL